MLDLISKVQDIKNWIYIDGEKQDTNLYLSKLNLWASVSTLPYNFYQGCAVVYNNEINILGSNSSSSYYRNHLMYGDFYTLTRS